jgi:hypothetical protein
LAKNLGGVIFAVREHVPEHVAHRPVRAQGSRRPLVAGERAEVVDERFAFGVNGVAKGLSWPWCAPLQVRVPAAAVDPAAPG